MTNVLMPPTHQPTGTMVPGGLHTQFVTIRNVGDLAFNMKYGPRDRLIIPPGQQVTVVEEVAWQFTGRWWQDNNNRNRDRVREYDRLRTLYGAYENDAEWEIARPTLEVYGSDGARITTVIDDPEGTQGGAPLTAFSKSQTLENQMAAMVEHQQQLELQIQRLVELQQAKAQPDTPSEAPPVQHHDPSNFTPGQPTADMGAAGRVPVAPPAVQVPTAPEYPASAPGPQIPLPQSTDGVALDANGEDDEEVIFGQRLEVTPELIPMPDDAMPPVDEPSKTRIKGK